MKNVNYQPRVTANGSSDSSLSSCKSILEQFCTLVQI